MKRNVRIISLFAMLLVMIGSIGLTASAAESLKKPYEYTFEVSLDGTKENRNFSGVAGVKNLVITFDKAIAATEDAIKDNITVHEGSDSETPSNVDIVDEVEIDGKTLTITFTNLEDEINYQGDQKVEYVLTIPKTVELNADQKDLDKDFEFPFANYDVLPGFKSLFLDLSEPQINDLIFVENAPRDIYVHVPKYYLQSIETIHRNEISPSLPNDWKQPVLTNIDVLTDTMVQRLKVSFDKILVRDLDPHPDVKGFSMGYAGIQMTNGASSNDFHLKAYDEFGRILEEDSFKVKYESSQAYKFNDYITKKPKEFGSMYTLYEIMDKPAIFENILLNLPEEKLNTIGVTYRKEFTSIGVSSKEEFEAALGMGNIKTIKLLGDITLSESLKIERSITIDGANYEITGNTIEFGTDENIDLNIAVRDLTIEQDVEVEVGKGTAIFENVTANKVEVKSVGVNSLYLTNFKATNGLVFKNSAPVRVVLLNTPDLNIILKSGGEVIVDGAANNLEVNDSSALLTMRKNTTFASLVVNDDMQLTVQKPEGVSLPMKTGNGKVIEVNSDSSSGENDYSDRENLGTLSKVYATSQLDWEKNGMELSYTGLDAKLASISSSAWTVANDDAFGEGSIISYDGNTRILYIRSDTILEPTTKSITLIADEGENKYRMTVSVAIE